MTTYVYTLAAVAARLRRGASSVLLFWPGSGALVECTKDNLAEVRALFRTTFKQV